ncbi:MAG: YidC/Oxa1 family membrane protein insertase [Actinobacteria bacterium]|nr:YidC/Oxa1 family membrane protein insertase [Actinomycetota bacterium]
MGLFEIFSGALTAFYGLIPSYGLAIILLTLAVRIVLLPLSIKQTRSMREMQRIQPEVKKIQAKHKGDRQKMNEEMMALYKEHGVNPFGGCAPLLLQFPVLIGLFYVIRAPLKYMGYAAPPNIPRRVFIAPADFTARKVTGILETLQHSRLAEDLLAHATRVYDFLGLHLNCSASGILRPPTATALESLTPGSRELTISCGSGLVSALPYLILVLLMGVTTWYQQKQMQARQDPNNPQAAQMQMFAKIMPVMLMFFAFSFPTGVVMYWLTTNVWTILQQRIILSAVPVAPGMPAPQSKKTDPAETSTPPKSTPDPNRNKKKKR